MKKEKQKTVKHLQDKEKFNHTQQKVNAIRKLYCPTYQEININWISATNKETPFIFESETCHVFLILIVKNTD
jgi:hypothetical protein